jgi:CheY-like chemotaxis protein
LKTISGLILADDISVTSDSRILINGLTNAIKFTKSGSIAVVLRISPDQKRIIIRIVDTGIGVSSDFRARLYEPFAKFDEFSPGAGLGLHITKALVGRMSGSLALHPNVDQRGSTFEVVLPIDVAPRGSPCSMIRKQIYTPPNDLWESQERTPMPLIDSGHKIVVPPSPIIPTDQERLRVLVVDDNVVNRKLLSLAVKKSPHMPSIKQANDGAQAIEVFRTFKPHLIFTDISMPVMDGLTSTTRIRTLEHDEHVTNPCVIYALTGLGTSDVRLRLDSLMGKAALNGWLVKGQHDLKVIADIVHSTAQRFGLDGNRSP